MDRLLPYNWKNQVWHGSDGFYPDMPPAGEVCRFEQVCFATSNLKFLERIWAMGCSRHVRIGILCYNQTVVYMHKSSISQTQKWSRYVCIDTDVDRMFFAQRCAKCSQAQVNHGGWNDRMTQCCGRVGRLEAIDKAGDMKAGDPPVESWQWRTVGHQGTNGHHLPMPTETYSKRATFKMSRLQVPKNQHISNRS